MGEDNVDEKAKTDEKKEEKKEEKEKDKKDSTKEVKKEKEKPKEPKKPKVETVKVDLSTEGSRNDVTLLDGTFFDSSKTKLEALAKADAEREKLGGECSKVSDWLDEEAGVFTPVEK